DLIVTSGGLGPTADDLTAEVVARFAEREMELDEEMEEKIAAILRGFARRFRVDEEAIRLANRKQAMVPNGATTIDPVGTAPGLVVRAAGGPDHNGPRSVRLFRRQCRDLFQRGKDGVARRRTAADRDARGGLARGGRGHGAGCARALRSGRRGLGDRHRRTGWRQR